MEESHSSDLFYESIETDEFSFNRTSAMESVSLESYETLVATTKLALCSGFRNELNKPSFSTYFAALIEDCRLSISQSIDLILNLLSSCDVQTTYPIVYLDNSICLLHLLSEFTKTIVEQLSVSCSGMKVFPMAVGRIILSVFTHCRDSESLYGCYLSNVQIQLKDLFRMCHELQVTYLMIMEKHFVFDLNETEEQQILYQALDINLKIGEIVETLDVKTMAEQWKAFMAICEKYSKSLHDTNIHEDCTKILCQMIESNLKTAVQTGQEEKVILRSLKVASFTIKILTKICVIFKHLNSKNFVHIVELLVYIHTHNSAYLELTGRPEQFIRHVNANVLTPSTILLKELLSEKQFSYNLFRYELEDIESDRVLGFVVLIASGVRTILQNDVQIPKIDLINCLFNALHYCSAWISHDLNLSIENTDKSYGLFEFLLSHTVALVPSLTDEELASLDTRMVEELFNTECYVALFASNLWSLVARLMQPSLLLKRIFSLSECYLKLEKHTKQFFRSPSQHYIGHTLANLFQLLPDKEKNEIFQRYNVNEKKHFGLWRVFTIRNLPLDLQRTGEDAVVQRMVTQQQLVKRLPTADNMDDLIKLMRLATTGLFKNDEFIPQFILNGWSRICGLTGKSNLPSSAWFYDYMEALSDLTCSMMPQLGGQILMVLHVIAIVLKKGSFEHKFLVLSPLCRLILMKAETLHKNPKTVSLLVSIIKRLSRDETIIKNEFFDNLSKYASANNLYVLINEISSEDNTSYGFWDDFAKYVDQSDSEEPEVMNFKYQHKCVLQNADNELLGDLKKVNSGNFDFADIDSFFDVESETEPASKRAKTESIDTEAIIKRLESDTSLLCDAEKSVFTNEFKSRIRNMCLKLENIIT